VAYDLILAVQHDRDFSFENLYVQAETTFPDKSVISHPVSLQLADSQGLWLGKCGKNSCETEIYISPKSYFRSTGLYMLKFTQHSRQDSLPGILGLELRIQEAESY
jgi:gliding motility-associated lipoprotein GldH